MFSTEKVQEMERRGRRLRTARTGDPDLGPFEKLPGVWKNVGLAANAGWNVIALPYRGAEAPHDARLLLNQYSETLTFTMVDSGVMNRGLPLATGGDGADQVVVALDYQQVIAQVAATDHPSTGLAGGPGKAIHHEPGLFLHMTNRVTDGLEVARLATVPHGNAVMALGTATTCEGVPDFPDFSALPRGLGKDEDDLDDAPNPRRPHLIDLFRHFHASPFKGMHEADGAHPGFNPSYPMHLLRLDAQALDIRRSTILDFDTTLGSGGIGNTPFNVAQSRTAAMRSIFWIHELEDLDAEGKPKLALQYAQIVILEFLRHNDGIGRIRWPHVCINTMLKVSDAPMDVAQASEAVETEGPGD